MRAGTWSPWKRVKDAETYPYWVSTHPGTYGPHTVKVEKYEVYGNLRRTFFSVSFNYRCSEWEAHRFGTVREAKMYAERHRNDRDWWA